MPATYIDWCRSGIFSTSPRLSIEWFHFRRLFLFYWCLLAFYSNEMAKGEQCSRLNPKLCPLRFTRISGSPEVVASPSEQFWHCGALSGGFSPLCQRGHSVVQGWPCLEMTLLFLPTWRQKSPWYSMMLSWLASFEPSSCTIQFWLPLICLPKPEQATGTDWV